MEVMLECGRHSAFLHFLCTFVPEPISTPQHAEEEGIVGLVEHDGHVAVRRLGLDRGSVVYDLRDDAFGLAACRAHPHESLVELVVGRRFLVPGAPLLLHIGGGSSGFQLSTAEFLGRTVRDSLEVDEVDTGRAVLVVVEGSVLPNLPAELTGKTTEACEGVEGFTW